MTKNPTSGRPSKENLDHNIGEIYKMLDWIEKSHGKATGLYLDEVRNFVKSGELKLAICFVELLISTANEKKYVPTSRNYSDYDSWWHYIDSRNKYVDKLAFMHHHMKSVYFDANVWESIEKTDWDKVVQAGNRAEIKRSEYFKDKENPTPTDQRGV